MTDWLQHDHKQDVENRARDAEWRRTLQPDTFVLLKTAWLRRTIDDHSALAPSEQIVYVKLVDHVEHIAWVFVSHWSIWVPIDLLEPFRIPQLAGEPAK